MAVTAQEYVEQLKALLPPGPAWPRGDSASMFALLIETWGAEFARVDARARALILEADPRFCQETFEDWLKQWGLPDDCIKLWSTVNNTTLRKLLIQKVTSIGGQTPKFFIDLASMFGYTIEIDEFRGYTVMADTLDVLAEELWPSTWEVNVLQTAGAKMTYHEVTGGVEEPLAWWGDALIECLIRRYAPAHTEVSFAYIDEVK